MQDVFIHLELCYTLHERSFSKIHNRGTLIDGLGLLLFCYHEETNSSTSRVAWGTFSFWMNYLFIKLFGSFDYFNEGTVNDHRFFIFEWTIHQLLCVAQFSGQYERLCRVWGVDLLPAAGAAAAPLSGWVGGTGSGPVACWRAQTEPLGQPGL